MAAATRNALIKYTQIIPTVVWKAVPCILFDIALRHLCVHYFYFVFFIFLWHLHPPTLLCSFSVCPAFFVPFFLIQSFLFTPVWQNRFMCLNVLPWSWSASLNYWKSVLRKSWCIYFEMNVFTLFHNPDGDTRVLGCYRLEQVAAASKCKKNVLVFHLQENYENFNLLQFDPII